MPETKLTMYLTETQIIKPQEETDDYITGYDVITEAFVKVRRDETTILPECILKIAADERVMLAVAREFGDTDIKVGQLLNTSSRTVRRIEVGVEKQNRQFRKFRKIK